MNITRHRIYDKYTKRFLDILISVLALAVLSPIIIALFIAGIVLMKGNPLFTQLRPGKDEKIFRLIKFRTMTNAKDENGMLLPDEERLIPYGKFLRSTSLDELPELINIIKGDMSIVGPRPLMVNYLPLYNDEQRQRHLIRPGLTGLAQIRGRNLLSWKERFKYDVEYVNNMCFKLDVKIITETIALVIKREGISSKTSETMEDFDGNN